MGAVAKSYMRKGSLIYEEMRNSLTIYEEAFSLKWLCNRSLLNFLIYEENSIFFYISVYTTKHIYLFLICYLQINYEQLFISHSPRSVQQFVIYLFLGLLSTNKIWPAVYYHCPRSVQQFVVYLFLGLLSTNKIWPAVCYHCALVLCSNL